MDVAKWCRKKSSWITNAIKESIFADLEVLSFETCTGYRFIAPRTTNNRRYSASSTGSARTVFKAEIIKTHGAAAEA